MLAKQIQKNIEEFDKEIEKLIDFMFVLEYDERNKYLISKENWLADSDQYPESWFELDPDKICQFIEQSQLLLIETMIERLENMMKKVTTDNLNVYNGICGYNKALQDQIDYLKAERAIIEKM